MQTTNDALDIKQQIDVDEAEYLAAVRRKAKESFLFYYNHIFADTFEKLEGRFVRGDWHDRFCQRLQYKLKTSTLAPRKHAKTVLFQAHVSWLIYRADITKQILQDYLYIMYSDELAGEKLKYIKQVIKTSEHFAHCRDLKPTSETVLEYQVGKNLVGVKGAGILKFKRGKHPNGIYCDDILKDPTQALEYSQIEKITQIFQAEITPMTKEGGFIHLAGTSQDKTDIFHVVQQLDGWDWEKNAAIIDRKKKIVLWKELYPYERLIDIEKNETGEKNFLREYQQEPVRSVEGYFSQSEYDNMTDRELTNYSLTKNDASDVEFGNSYLGWDIGKKQHPSHIAIFQAIHIMKEQTAEEKRKRKAQEIEKAILVQVCSAWLDGVDYAEQLEQVRAAIKKFGVCAGNYDGTRGELDGFAELGMIPSELTPKTASATENVRTAADFDRLRGRGEIILNADPRQRSQVLSVNNALQAPTSPEGHGDSFWSIGLAIRAFIDYNTKYIL
jgi:hypothetical protein